MHYRPHTYISSRQLAQYVIASAGLRAIQVPLQRLLGIAGAPRFNGYWLVNPP